MMQLIKPQKLHVGDTIATVSLSDGASGELNMLKWYEVSKRRIHDLFGLNVIETSNSMKGRDYIYKHPEARADDLMEALQNPSIKAIFLNQGGDDAIRILPYIDLDVIRSNPKIFLGFSDATIIHFMFLKAGISSFSGPNVLTTLSEPVRLHEYTEKWINKILFDSSPIGNIEPSTSFFNEPIDWENGLHKQRTRKKNNGYEVLQGNGTVRGRLVGGTLGPIVYMIKGTVLFPTIENWEDTIIFLDAMSPYSSVLALVHMLRGLASARIFDKAKGIIFSNIPRTEETESIKQTILQVIHDEENLEIPILFNVNFGHVAPMNILPYGAMAEIDCDDCTFTVLESGVRD